MQMMNNITATEIMNGSLVTAIIRGIRPRKICVVVGQKKYGFVSFKILWNDKSNFVGKFFKGVSF